MKKILLSLCLIALFLAIGCHRESTPIALGNSGFYKFYITRLASEDGRKIEETVWGVKNVQEKILIPPEHTSIEYLDGYFLAGVKNGILLKDSNNILVFPQSFETIKLREDSVPVPQKLFECSNEDGSSFYIPQTGQKFFGLDDIILSHNEIIFINDNEIGAMDLNGNSLFQNAFTEFFIVNLADSSNYYYLLKLENQWSIQDKKLKNKRLISEKELKRIVTLADDYPEQQWNYQNHIGGFVIDKLPFKFPR